MMAEEEVDVIDSQILAENVGFLDNCFDNSFVLQSSLLTVKEYIAEEQCDSSAFKLNTSITKKKLSALSQNKSIVLDSSISKSTEIEPLSRRLSDWGLPRLIAQKYDERGIKEMFEWQVKCLGNPKVLLDCCNLVYSAPTSAGKTLVAEILTIKTILERQKKVIIILPFVSIVREKMFYLQDILSSSGIRVEGFMGSQSPPGGLQAVHVAICTIEKANSLVNRLLDEGNIAELGAVIVDELHLLGDPHRGYILELLLTKIKYITSQLPDVNIQIVGMSATLPNLEVLAHWLDAELFITQFRPIPLDEFCLVGNKLFDKQGQCVSKVESMDDSDNVLQICLNTIKDSCSVLIFCMTKNRCENLAQSVSSAFYKLGCSGNETGLILRQQLNTESISEVLEQLKNCPVGLDQVLKNTISFGVAYHHAGLTFDERDIIEGGFKSGAIRVLVATSTLSSGVNLPARKVIIRSPVFQRQPINILAYKQMVGRAGRMGRDTKGESILVCTENEKKIGFDLMMGALDPVQSCIENEDKYMRAVLEMIASQVACTKSDLDLYSKCTLLFQQDKNTGQNLLLDTTLEELKNFELIRLQEDGDEKKYVATHLGKACLSSSMAPNDGLSLFCELQKARQCLVLETDLHLIYLVTPYSVSGQWADIDWLHLLTLWESLTKAMKRVGELVGVQESFMIRCLRGTSKMKNVQDKLNIHKRFYTALALQDLVNEVPLSEVATKFQCARGFLQSLQQAAATFAGMVTAFCHQLGWKNMELLISQFQDRLHFGIHSELLELMKLTSLNGMRARTLFNAGFETISSIAQADTNTIETALYKSVPFQSEKEREDDDTDDMRKRKKMKNIWITGCCGMTAKEAAENLIQEARKYLELEIGVKEIKWESDHTETVVNEQNSQVVKAEDEHTTQVSDTQTNANSRITVAPNKNEITFVGQEGKHTKELGVPNSRSSLNNSETEDVYLSANVCNSNIDIQVERNEPFTNINNHHVKEKFESITINSSSPLINVLEIPISNSSPSIIKEEIIWDSIVIPESAIQNITKHRESYKLFSPNISFGEYDDKTVVTEPVSDNTANTKSNIKDISLFSSEGDNSSLFEESLPLEMIPSKLLDDNTTELQVNKPKKQETASDFLNINSNSVLNAFKSTLVVETDDEDNIVLVYEDNVFESETEKDLNTSEEVIETQNVNPISIKDSFKSPLKRQAEITSKQVAQPSAKKFKPAASIFPKKAFPVHRRNDNSSSTTSTLNMKIREPKTFLTLEFDNHKLLCNVLHGKDILDNFHVIENIKEAALYFQTVINISSSEVIGSNILKTKPKDDIKEDTAFVKAVTIYFGENTCIILDFTNAGSDLEAIKRKFSSWLCSKDVRFKVLSVKTNVLDATKCLGIDLLAPCFDIVLADWLITPSADWSVGQFINLMKTYCHIDNSLPLFNVNLNSVIRRKKYTHLNIYESSCVKAWCIWNIANKQEKILTEQFLKNVLAIEMEVSRILSDCECNGLCVNRELASKMLMVAKSTRESLKRKAFRIYGKQFNLNSPIVVAKVLGLEGRKVCTKKSVLITHKSEMAKIIMYYRKLNCIIENILYPITNKAVFGVGNRITPSYTTFTNTGRINMHDPNLQSVPRTFSIPLSCFTNTETNDVTEFNCRNIFIASPNHVLVSADYCQLEMRILTHLCGDEVLTRIMRSDVDVFKAVAAAWSGVSEDEVDDDLRQHAKQICYGILYGMGTQSLSQQLNVSVLEAAEYMNTFHNAYPGIKVYTAKVIEDCKKYGYVETLKKRRRYLPDIDCGNVAKRRAAERQAVNTTIQGSAADIVKAAMCAIDDKTKHNVPKPCLMLQMHDELIYEVPKDKKDSFVKMLKEVMEETVRLNVPLPVKVKMGMAWGGMEEMKIV